MQEKARVPAIRFAGFTDAWEQRKLGECFSERIESMPGGELLSVTISEGIKRFSDLGRHNNSNEDKSKYKKVCIGDIAYNSMRMWQGASGYSPYEGIVSPAYTVLAPNPGINSQCLAYHFKLPEMIHTFQINSQGITSDTWNLKFPALSEIEIFVSADEREQEKIAGFSRHLDHLITLHQRKYSRLCNVKKSMLEKMFPKDGASVPEIRFAGFTDAWEQRKLSEIADKVTEKNVGLQFVETFTNSAEFGIISQRDFFDHDIAKLDSLGGYYIVRDEDFVYNPRISTSAPVGPINRNKLGRTGVMSPLYTVFRPHDIDATYLEHFFKCGYWHSFMNFNGDTGARSDRFSIKDEVFFQMPIPMPQIEEQIKIGKYLTHLDHLITLHQRELERLQNIKKSCLEKMFV